MLKCELAEGFSWDNRSANREMLLRYALEGNSQRLRSLCGLLFLTL